MKRFVRIFFLFFTLVLSSCFREELDVRMQVPEGTPVNIVLNFNTEEMLDVQVGTKMESSRADESRVHDLYVMIFNNDDEDKECFYKRFFSYEHLEANLNELLSKPNEGWYVENVSLEQLASDATKKTRGVVKISTEAHPNCTLVLLANVVNTVTSLDGQDDPVDYLSDIENLAQLKNIKVVLEQQAVNRKDLFLMMGVRGDPALSDEDEGWDTSLMTWDEGTGNYTAKYQVPLKPLDAKVKFRVRGNTDNISLVNPQYWRVYRLPVEGYLYPGLDSDPGESFFDTDKYYFETTESDEDGTWQCFTFYMLQNRQAPKLEITQANYDEVKEGHPEWESDITQLYHCRELQEKTPDTDHDGFLKNGDWVFAPLDATYVTFDLILTLTPDGISAISSGIATALTTDAIFTVHLGDFTSSKPVTPEETAGGITHNYDDYNTLRSVFYTYDIVINNSRSIYVEVRGEGTPLTPKETQPGQEGSLLLTTDGIINCDAHYEYHSMEFAYKEELGKDTDGAWSNRKKFSWYIKTPFNPDGIDPILSPTTGWYELRKDLSGKTLDYDYQWVLYTLNDKSGTLYTSVRKSYPGDALYNPAWYPYQVQENQRQYQLAYPDDYYNTLSSADKAVLDAALSARELNRATCTIPLLMDINQLVNFLFWQNEIRYQESEKPYSQRTTLFDSTDKIRVTAFVNEYYYERDPFTKQLDPNLWRTFVNAKPRELHILSDNEHSKDRRSDVVTSNQSIIQQSIQTIYNIYSPELSSLWGTEHNDELHKGSEKPDPEHNKIWPWWATGRALPAGSVLYNDEENGRINTAGLWGLTTGLQPRWNDFLNYAVDDNQPELRENYQYLAYACMTRNRDNNGNGIIDPDEVRWYTASINQLVGMWVGNESLSQTARLYQPKDGTATAQGTDLLWRSEVVSSTCKSSTDPTDPYIIRAEEGATKSDYSFYKFWADGHPEWRDQISSVRCLRNVGTFRDGGSQKDVTEAPYDRMVDQYYDFKEGTDGNGKAWSNEDGSYTIEFTRLNPKSIREYTAEDLPYHEEYALHNCVYLSLTAQNPHYWDDNDVHKDGGTAFNNNNKLDQINNAVSMHDDYCPPGYRLPNMTELLMMVASLPSTYWSDNTLYPSRTYFSRGKLGSNKTWSEAVKEEKIGWGFNKSNSYRMNLISGLGVKGVRCVKDDSDVLGDITGKVIVTNPYRQTIGGEMEIELNFTSMASAIQEVALALFYTKDGAEIPVPIEYTLPEASTIIQDEYVYFTIPNTISVRGQMTVKAVVRNAKGVVREFSAPIRVLSDLDLSIKLLPSEYDSTPTAPDDVTYYPVDANWAPISYTPTFPILLTAHNDDNLKIKSWTLLVTPPDGRMQRITDVPLRLNNKTGTASGGDVTYASVIYEYNPYANGGSLQQGTYTFQLEAVIQEDGTTERLSRSEIVSMDILKVNYEPNTTEEINAAYTYQASHTTANTLESLSGLWRREKVDGLDFSSGDFIETTMDVTRCVYVEFDHSGSSDAGKHNFGLDNLISFGVNGINWSPNEFHIYYPAKPKESSIDDFKWLYCTPVWDNSTGYEGSLISRPDPKKLLQIRLDNNGFYWNDIPIGISHWSQANQADVRSVFEKLLRSSTLYIGSTEGPHRSRAYYYYVRVVYNGRDTAIRGGNSNFKENPGNGGNL